MATASLPAARGGMSASALVTRDIDITRLYRAFVTAPDWRQPELTVFVTAGTREAAVRKIADCIAVLEYRKPEGVVERIYNLTSAEELIAEGLGDDHALRLFETGYSGGKLTHFVQHPLVLLASPGSLLQAWARIPRPSTEGRP